MLLTPSPDNEYIRHRGIADPGFGSAQSTSHRKFGFLSNFPNCLSLLVHLRLLIPHCLGFHSGWVRSMVWFGESKGADFLATDQLGKILLFLRFTPWKIKFINQWSTNIRCYRNCRLVRSPGWSGHSLWTGNRCPRAPTPWPKAHSPQMKCQHSHNPGKIIEVNLSSAGANNSGEDKSEIADLSLNLYTWLLFDDKRQKILHYFCNSFKKYWHMPNLPFFVHHCFEPWVSSRTSQP